MNQATRTVWRAPHANSVSLTLATMAVDVAKARMLFPPTAVRLRALVDEIIAKNRLEATDEEIRHACREIGMQWMRWEATQQRPLMTNRTLECDVITASAGASLPLGVALPGGKTNHPGRPDFEGQIGVFRSPFDVTIWLVDVASAAQTGELQWLALRRSDERYARAIECARAGESLTVLSPSARESTPEIGLINDLLAQANMIWESLAEADRARLNAFHVTRASIGATLPAAARAAAALASPVPLEFQELYELLRGTWKEWYLLGSGAKFKEQHHAIAFAAAAKVVGIRSATVLPYRGDCSGGWIVGTMDPEGADLLKLIADGRF